MKTNIHSIVVLALSVLCGCTSYALRRSTANQAKTVNDFLADEVLYNLALYKDYYDGKRVNGLPAFVKLSSGQSQVQQSINAQMALKIATGPAERDPQISGAHQTTDNWVFAPVVDPNELNRLFMIYKAEFTSLSPAEVKAALPLSPPVLDQNGRPFLNYAPVIENGHVKMTNNAPVFDATPKLDAPRSLDEIPGAYQNGKVVGTWFSFEPPTKSKKWFRVGPYLNKYIWITNPDNFFKFALVTLGGTNGVTTPKVPATLLLQNGNNIFTVPQ